MTPRRLVLAVCTLLPLQAGAAESPDCLILPGTTIDLGGAIPGQLAEVAVDLGARVSKGQVVASLNTSVQQAVLDLAALRARNHAQIDAARARLDFEDKQLSRSTELRARGVVAQSDSDERATAYEVRKRELEAAEMEFELAQLDLARAEAEFEVRRIRSPIDGIIAERHLDPGEYLRDDGKIVTIVSLDPLRVDVFLPQAAYPEIHLGQLAEITPEGPGGAPASAHVTAFDQTIDAASATFRVRLELPNPDRRIIAGTRCNARFQ
ncbi:efflux RND transporter periplasmic adaptor subunit [Phaeovulum sp. NW3]|nr:efflux RND transporter periplasmic adaptor subunit [Phaeovulum sp. NW3]